MRIAQITDLHIAEDGGFMRRFVDANAKLDAAIGYLNERAGSVDAVVITGDVANDGRPEQYELLRELLDRLTVPWYMVPGNHDEIEPFRSAFADRPWMPSTGSIDFVVDEHPVRLIGLDSTVPERHDGELFDDQLAWVDSVLSTAPDRPTVLFLHHPPFLTGLWLFDAIRLTGGDALRDVVLRHPQVRLVVAGHVHRPVSSMWGTTMLTTSSSTTHQSRCDLHPDEGAGVVSETPMLQLHDVTEHGVVSHWTPFEAPERTLEIGALVSDWPTARDRIVAGPPFPKGSGGFI